MNFKMSCLASVFIVGGMMTAEAVTTTISSTACTIYVPEGETVGIEAALNAGGSSTSKIDWVLPIYKTGLGQLNLDVDFSRWWGNMYIKEGVVFSKCANGLGNTTERLDDRYINTHVESGATLLLSNEGNKFTIGGHIIRIAGNGAAGYEGALVLQVWSGGNLANIYPGRVMLEGDATWNIQHKGEANSLFENKKLDLQGHKLTLNALGGNDEHRCIFSNVTVTPGSGEGKIVVGDKLRVGLRRATTFNGTGEIELTGLGSIDMVGIDGVSTVAGSANWTIKGNSETSKGISGNYTGSTSFSRSFNVWEGPLNLARPTYMKMNWTLGDSLYGLLTFSGKVTGQGGLYGKGRTNGPSYLMLSNAANDFQGGVAITNMTLGLSSATALPATGKAAQFTDASLQLLEPAAAQPSVVTFPELDFTVSAGKTSEIGSKLDTLADGEAVVGTTTKITKRGAGVLNSKAALAADEINLEGGVLKLPATAEREAGARRLQAGLHAGDVRLGISDTPFKAAYENGKYLTLCITNRVALSPEIYYLPANYYPAGNNEWGEHYYQRFNSWDGYIWNNTDQVKTWKVVDTCNSIQRLTIGSAENAYTMEADRISPWTDEINSSYAPKTYTVTLQPGANRFIVRTYDRFAYKNFQHGNVRVQGLENWTDAHGLMYTEKLDSVDMNDYHPFIDSGDGMLFTRVADVSVPSVSVVRGNGGTLDLQDGSLSATAIEGKPVVTGGTLNVTDTWTLTADQLKNDVRLAGVTFAESSELDVAAADLAQLKVGAKGYVIASGYTGRVPKVSADMKADGWKLLLEDGILRLAKPQGLVIIFR